MTNNSHWEDELLATYEPAPHNPHYGCGTRYSGPCPTDEHPIGDIYRFISARPYYAREHVQAIAAHVDEQGIPFCDECSDWHFAGELHSS